MASRIVRDSSSQMQKCSRITLLNAGFESGQGVAPENGSSDTMVTSVSGPISKISFLSRWFLSEFAIEEAPRALSGAIKNSLLRSGKFEECTNRLPYVTQM